MSNGIGSFKVLATFFALLFSIDFTHCGYIGLSSGEIEKMPKMLVHNLIKKILFMEKNYKTRKNRQKFVELLASFTAFSVYFLLGGIQLFTICIRDLYFYFQRVI